MLKAQYLIIPQPNVIEYKKSLSKVGESLCLDFDKSLTSEVEIAAKSLRKDGWNVSFKSGGCTDSKSLKIDLKIDKSVNSDEGYKLSLIKNKMNLSAKTSAGIFNGLQTILQILRDKNTDYKDFAIEDNPRFKWRGLMFDVSRHFFTVSEVKEYIDLMSKYKFNTFHWHLTDDEGWRVEIKSLPKLTSIGAWRSEGFGKFGTRNSPKKEDPKTYGGFYTQDEIRDVVNYAKERQIIIVPEIDVPGHSMALLAAYPELSTKKEERFVSNGFKFSEWFADGTFKMLVENTVNPADEEVYKTLDKIFKEVAALFPGQYIHVGGDEAYHGFWEEDEGCKKLMQKEGLKNSLELQSYFMKRLEKIISSNGKKMIGWDEILYGGLADGTAVMSWRGMKGGIEAAKQGHDVVMSPTDFAYLDYTQGDHSLELPIYRDLSLAKVYEFDPLPEGIDKKYVLGGQGNLWTEQVPTFDYAVHMTYPRSFALSECLWSMPQNKDWSFFTKKVDKEIAYLESNDLSISKAIYDPIIDVRNDGNKLLCKLKSEYPGTEIRYTIDNTHPTKKSKIYSTEFVLPEGDYSIRVNNFKDGKVIGRTLYVHRTELVKRAGKKK